MDRCYYLEPEAVSDWIYVFRYAVVRFCAVKEKQ